MKNYGLLLIAILTVIVTLLYFREIKSKQEVLAEVEIWKTSNEEARASIKVMGESKRLEEMLSKQKILFLEGEIEDLRKRGPLVVTSSKVITDTVEVSITTTDTVYITTARTHNFTYKDDWFNSSGTIDLESKNITMSYSVKDSVDMIYTQDKTGYKVDLISYNPNSYYVGAQSIKIEKKKKIQVKPGIFTGITNQGPAVGVGLVITR